MLPREHYFSLLLTSLRGIKLTTSRVTLHLAHFFSSSSALVFSFQSFRNRAPTQLE